MTDDLPDFDGLVDLLRIRLGDADALNDSAIHSFKELMADRAEGRGSRGPVLWNAFEDLEAQGHLDPASHKVFGLDACERLSAEGRWYLRSVDRPLDDDS